MKKDNNEKIGALIMLFTVGDLAKHVDGKIIGDENESIKSIASLENAKKGDITFAVEKEKARRSKASCVILKETLPETGFSQIIVDNPYLAFIKILKLVENEFRIKPENGIHPLAVISKNVEIEEDVSIGAFTYIGENTKIKKGTIIYSSVYIGENVSIGSNAIIYPNVSIRENIVIGNNVIIHCGSVVGSDGYAYKLIQGKHIKIPQVGKVIIEDDVEIGANVAIDRATVDVTYIGKGTKIDNLVHIGHNVIIGENVLITAQVGIAGSCKIENYAVLAGQAGVKDHVNIGEGAIIGAQAGIIGDIPPGVKVWGTPARDLKDVLKSEAYLKKLPDVIKRLKILEEKLGKLENKNL
ncbi:MAG: UDP-3-O-(3-hydroxymyristoyl)glucosamine N-acyltransferase [Candidatus Firestonebacteria bacterium]|nr:UDP-3-O-(3-hydroxymyristoyl)glucosamine N-acyltransferase [Candidatus Firestonebacteria bacterium]